MEPTYTAHSIGEGTDFEIVGPAGALGGATPEDILAELWDRIERREPLQLRPRHGYVRTAILNPNLIEAVEVNAEEPKAP